MPEAEGQLLPEQLEPTCPELTKGDATQALEPNAAANTKSLQEARRLVSESDRRSCSQAAHCETQQPAVGAAHAIISDCGPATPPYDAEPMRVRRPPCRTQTIPRRLR